MTFTSATQFDAPDVIISGYVEDMMHVFITALLSLIESAESFGITCDFMAHSVRNSSVPSLRFILASFHRAQAASALLYAKIYQILPIRLVLWMVQPRAFTRKREIRPC